MYPALYCIYFLSAFLAAVCFAEGIAVRTSQPGRTQALANRPRSPTFEPRFVSRIVGKTGPDVPNDHELLDIVLVASVDGKFHALNRTDGRSLWSMAPSSESVPAAESVPSSLSPLIKTNHIDYDPDLMDETTNQEIYIIEPQSGDIYVTSTPAGPMHRFPFSMPELVDMSPFSFSADEGGRLFIGKKETSLLVVELETGRVKASLTAERIFDYEDGHLISDEIDLDELEEEKPARSPVREVLIGRTGVYPRPGTFCPFNLVLPSSPRLPSIHIHQRWTQPRWRTSSQPEAIVLYLWSRPSSRTDPGIIPPDQRRRLYSKLAQRSAHGVQSQDTGGA